MTKWMAITQAAGYLTPEQKTVASTPGFDVKELAQSITAAQWKAFEDSAAFFSRLQLSAIADLATAVGRDVHGAFGEALAGALGYDEAAGPVAAAAPVAPIASTAPTGPVPAIRSVTLILYAQPMQWLVLERENALEPQQLTQLAELRAAGIVGAPLMKPAQIPVTPVRPAPLTPPDWPAAPGGPLAPQSEPAVPPSKHTPRGETLTGETQRLTQVPETTPTEPLPPDPSGNNPTQ